MSKGELKEMMELLLVGMDDFTSSGDSVERNKDI
jgi:hypothetical protein